jgi:hypothetical protein
VILVLTSSEDRGADPVIAELARRGAAVATFDGAELPRRASISIAWRDGRWTRRIDRVRGDVIDLDRVTAIWYRKPSSPEPLVHDDERVRRYAALEWSDVLGDLWHTLACRWLPGPPHAILAADGKLRGLALAASLGLTVPPTAVTSRPEDLVACARAWRGDAITKAPGPRAFLSVFAGALVRYTEPLRRRDLAAWRRTAHAPVLIQRRVPKRVEVRVTVVGAHVFAAEIDSQVSHHGRHDWRRYDLRSTPIRVHALPPAVEDACRALVRALGLRYAAIDLIVTPDDEYVFLEVNATGQYGWIEDATGLAISSSICDALLAEDAHG